MAVTKTIECQCCPEKYSVTLEGYNIVKIEHGVKGVLNGKVCLFCKNPLTVDSLYSASKSSVDPMMGIFKNLQNKSQLPESNEITLSLALFYLLNGDYNDARYQIEEIIKRDAYNYKALYYWCIALLAGKKPCMCLRGLIDTMEQRLKMVQVFAQGANDTAFLTRSLYLQAFIKYDYYERSFKQSSPKSSSLIDQAVVCGLNSEVKEELFGILKYELPKNF